MSIPLFISLPLFSLSSSLFSLSLSLLPGAGPGPGGDPGGRVGVMGPFDAGSAPALPVVVGADERAANANKHRCDEMKEHNKD